MMYLNISRKKSIFLTFYLLQIKTCPETIVMIVNVGFSICYLNGNVIVTAINSGVPIGLNLGHCPITNPKCPIVFSKPGQNVR